MIFPRTAVFVSIVFVVILFLMVSSCKRKPGPDPDSSSEFSKKQMLESLADKIILPNFNQLKQSVAAFKINCDSFNLNPTNTRLTQLRQNWDSAYVDFIHCNAFNFGPGEIPVTGTFAENLGIWPVNVSRVEQRILDKNYSFSDFERDTRGFQTIEYLLFSPGSLAKFQDSISGPDRRAYLEALSNHLSNWVFTVVDAWPTYRQTFVNNDGKDAGSSASLLYNNFLLSFESIKNYKLGIPAGIRAGQTQAEPEKSESYFSGYSTRHLKEHFKAIENIWRGNSRTGTEGIGFDDWLNSIQDGKSLLSETQTKFAELNTMNNKLKFRDYLRVHIDLTTIVIVLLIVAIFYRPLLGYLFNFIEFTNQKITFPVWVRDFLINIGSEILALLFITFMIFIFIKLKSKPYYAGSFTAYEIIKEKGKPNVQNEWGSLYLTYNIFTKRVKGILTHNASPITIKIDGVFEKERYLRGSYIEKNKPSRLRLGAFIMLLDVEGDDYIGEFLHFSPTTGFEDIGLGEAKWVRKKSQ